MNNERYSHTLRGCSPTPIASYLKALGILRLVAEQADASATGSWHGDVFVLETTLDRPALETFFLNEYAPSPIMAPWNGGSGFYEGDNRKALSALLGSTATRFQTIARTAAECASLLEELGLRAKPSDDKDLLLMACRNTLSDAAVSWLDAAFVLTNDGPKYPPLLGTGGNDGRLEFTNNFMQHLLALIDPATGEPTASAGPRLLAALWGDAASGLDSKSKVGQFLPGGAGGANSGQGYDGKSQLNPWDFVLLLEGAILFGSAATRRLGSTRVGSSYPFHVRHVGVGSASASIAEEGATRGEMWLPTWAAATSLSELQRLLSEGRIDHGTTTARDSVDVIRALSSLGVARGIDRFVRYGFQVRNGLSYLAVPLGIHRTGAQPELSRLAELDHAQWLSRTRRAARDKFAPGRVTGAARRLEDTIFALSDAADPGAATYNALVAVSELEQSLATSLRWSSESRLRPVPVLSAAWLMNADADTWTPEQRLGAALASIGGQGRLRQHIEPVAFAQSGPYFLDRWGPEQTWRTPRLESAMIDTLLRRLLPQRAAMATRKRSDPYRDAATLPATLDDVRLFLAGETDDAALRTAAMAFALIDPNALAMVRMPRARDRQMPAAYALCKLCFATASLGLEPIPAQPTIARALSAGNSTRATELASRRIRIAGGKPIGSPGPLDASSARRLAAALLIPIDSKSTQTLTKTLRPGAVA